MPKPVSLTGYDERVTEACERVLVTLFSRLGPWRESVFLIGGLAPRYLVQQRPPDVPRHAGTGDIDVVVDLSVLTNVEAYRSLEANLAAIGFERGTNEKGTRVNWRWRIETEEGVVVILELLADNPELRGGVLQELPTDGNISAINIPYASLVFDLNDRVEITAELLNGGGRATETIPYANIVSFTCLKAFAFEHRRERKDAHDLIYCLEYGEGGFEGALPKFMAAREGAHGSTIEDALKILRDRFCDPIAEEGYLREGPVAVARFELGEGDDAEIREQRALRQRQVNALIVELLDRFR